MAGGAKAVEEPKFYLGDGLYGEITDGHVILSAERDGMKHWVALDAVVLDNFLSWLAEIRKGLIHPV